MSFPLVVLEVLCFCLGGVLFISAPSRRVSESLSLGICLGLMLLSVIFQISFLLKLPQFSFILEGLFLIFIFYHARKKYSEIKKILIAIKHFFLKYKLITSIILICWIHFFLLATIIPPANWDSMTYNLARVFLFQQEKTFFLTNVTTPRQAIFVVGSDVLPHAFLRFYSDYGVGLFSFLAYLSIGLGTYALSRNFVSVKISLLATVIIIGMPELCFQATSTKNDIFTASAAIFCFISVYRLLNYLNKQDLSLIILGLTFGLSVKTTFLAFFVPFSVIFGYLILRKYSVFEIVKLIKQNKLYFIIILFPALIMSQIWLFLYHFLQVSDINIVEDKNIKMVIGNNNRLFKGIANFIRYIFQSIHLFPFDNLLLGRLKIDFDQFLNNIYNLIFFPLFGNAGLGYSLNAPRPFLINSEPHEDLSWYGIAGFFVILPSLVWTLYKGNSFLKALSLTLIGFFLIVCFGIYWTPWNNRYLTLFFSASGLCIAFFLQSIYPKIKNRGIQFLQIVFIIILISSCLLNSSKPFAGLSIKQFLKPNIWLKTNFGTNRFYYANRHFEDERLAKFAELIPVNSQVALLAGDNSWIYPFYLINPQIIIQPVALKELQQKNHNFDYTLCLDVGCTLISDQPSYKVLWASNEESKKLGKIIKINPE
ncbi:glycosyltransferase family 39 protein [Chroococcus sp. FPU101]|uniref:glycosyltransferase family 39 protein n=1 Tax=Chroococcus sp. FPU101 TaxID=1974212 RepID=UPI001A8FD01C|nr:glycosyltransferase family 39 protein [Chroococcus sp. FPU101]GFE67662.1 hypothetical protein CFPU101_02720 [Chroococcus sp. FPU101]